MIVRPTADGWIAVYGASAATVEGRHGHPCRGSSWPPPGGCVRLLLGGVRTAAPGWGVRAAAPVGEGVPGAAGVRAAAIRGRCLPLARGHVP